MKVIGIFAVTMLTTALLGAGCSKQETPVEKAVESTKDALDLREHEKLKDAGEDAKDAVDNAAEGIKKEMDEE